MSIINSNDRGILKKSKLQEITQQIDPRHSLDPEVEEILLEIADDFIESVTTMASNLAKHRGSDTLEVKDLQLYLENTWDVKIPGFTPSSSVVSSSTEEVPRITKRPGPPEVHKQRLAFVKKAQDQIQKQKQKQQEKKQ